MQTKKENSWFMLRMLLLVNIVLIAAIVLANGSNKTAIKDQQSCSSLKESCNGTKKINADVLNAITIKLM